MSNLVTGLAQFIGANVAGATWALDNTANVFEGFLPPEPDECIAVLPYGGFEPDAGLPYDRPNIQIIVRSGETPTWALNMWYAVYNRVQSLRNTTLPDGTYLVYSLAIQSGPIHIGKDDNGRFQYGLNLRCETRNPTQERP